MLALRPTWPVSCCLFLLILCNLVSLMIHANGSSAIVRILKRQSPGRGINLPTFGTNSTADTDQSYYSYYYSSSGTNMTSNNANTTVNPVMSPAVANLTSTNTSSRFAALEQDLISSDPNAVVEDGSISVASSIQTIASTSVFGMFNDSDIIQLVYNNNAMYLGRCEQCGSTVYANDTSSSGQPLIRNPIVSYLVVDQTMNPGRVAQFKVEVVDASPSVFQPSIRLVADNGYYLRVAYEDPRVIKPLVADSASPDVNGTTFNLSQIASGNLMFYSDDGSVLQWDSSIKDKVGTVFYIGFGPMANANTLQPVAQPANISYMSWASLTVPFLNSGRLAPFAQNDVITLSSYPTLLNLERMKKYDILTSETPTTYQSRKDLLVLQTVTNSTRQQFRVNFIGDPRDGIFQMTGLNGSNVYISSQECYQCSRFSYKLVLMNGTMRTTDWQLSPSGLGWDIRPVRKDGESFPTGYSLKTTNILTNSGWVAVVGPTDSSTSWIINVVQSSSN